MNRRGETKHLSVSQVTLRNKVTWDTNENPIEIIIDNFYDFLKLKALRSMPFFLYETKIIPKPYPEISASFRPTQVSSIF